MKTYLVLMLGMLVTVATAETLPCKPNGQGYYGRTSAYDLGNPSVPNCPKEAN